ncbi:MAG: (d)CMP kinase [Rickettsiaceae bacterium]|nr:(d)CMP kinase [Rickettsiaceae bacterium]
MKEKFINTENPLIIALDGPSSVGKGTIARKIARRFALSYVQSSIVYRGLAYLCISKNVALNDVQAVLNVMKNNDVIADVENKDLSSEEIGTISSKISAIPEVREYLSRYLKQLVLSHPRIIMEGRDIGTVIAPNADLKLFLTADVKIRAKRRYKQLLSKGKKCIIANVMDQLMQRDKRDSQRKTSPMKPAKDAVIIDTTYLNLNKVIQEITDLVGL